MPNLTLPLWTDFTGRMTVVRVSNVRSESISPAFGDNQTISSVLTALSWSLRDARYKRADVADTSLKHLTCQSHIVDRYAHVGLLVVGVKMMADL